MGKIAREDETLRWERKIINRSLGGRKTEDGNVRRSTDKMYDIYKELGRDMLIKARRLMEYMERIVK